jgi:tripartite-type tricarboxylate transporter receptor subunit TctC
MEMLGGQIQLLISGPPGVLPHIRGGRLKAIATTAAQRSPGLPEVPTFAESGLPGFDTYEWYGVFAPAGLPRDLLARLNREIARIIKLPEMSEQLTVQGAIPVGNSSDEFGAFLQGKLAQRVGLRPD